MATYALDGTIGVSATTPTVEPQFALGEIAAGSGNKILVYGVASGAVAVGSCTLDANFNITDAAGNWNSEVAIPAGQYCWVTQAATA